MSVRRRSHVQSLGMLGPNGIFVISTERHHKWEPPLRKRDWLVRFIPMARKPQTDDNSRKKPHKRMPIPNMHYLDGHISRTVEHVLPVQALPAQDGQYEKDPFKRHLEQIAEYRPKVREHAYEDWTNQFVSEAWDEAMRFVQAGMAEWKHHMVPEADGKKPEKRAEQHEALLASVLEPLFLRYLKASDVDQGKFQDRARKLRADKVAGIVERSKRGSFHLEVN